MHGLGNDFVVLDGRASEISISPAQAQAISDRRFGVGFDQLLIIKPALNPDADIFMEILNADGSAAEACGNGTRCVAALMMDESGAGAVNIETVAGVLSARRDDDGMVSVDMGPVGLQWSDIPLASAADTLHLDVEIGPLRDPVGVNIGNPHAVFFVDDAEAVDIETLGPQLETHAMFPERANIEVVSSLGPDKLRMRVWERAVGITQACGSGACAVGVAAFRRGITSRRSEIVLDGGALFIEWREDGHVLMAGPTQTVYHGTLDPSLMAV
ncbi:MAG: diaminopimelate epimerase, partial [Rhodospirillaceae bacterium]|nr:diaminopimelate epimerase [Rhodospirillaceae bacterium]